MARAIAYRPDVLLLDEPFSSLDARLRSSLRTDLRQLQRTLGITTVFVTHDQQEALALSDRLAVMNAGSRRTDRNARSHLRVAVIGVRRGLRRRHEPAARDGRRRER